MSFTLYRTRNGMPEPIKISLIDAFRGAPDPRPRREKQTVTESRPNTNNNSKDKPTEDSSGNRNFSNHETETYSPSDDQTLIQMKLEGATWADILNALGKKSKSQAQAHYRDLQGKGVVAKHQEDHSGGNKNKDEAKADQSNGNNDNQKSQKGKIKSKTTAVEHNNPTTNPAAKSDIASKKQRKADRKAAASAASAPKVSFADAGTPKKIATSTSSGTPGKKGKDKDKEMTEEEITKAVKKFAYEYDRKKWEIVASRYFDITGIRLDGCMAKQRFDL